MSLVGEGSSFVVLEEDDIEPYLQVCGSCLGFEVLIACVERGHERWWARRRKMRMPLSRAPPAGAWDN